MTGGNRHEWANLNGKVALVTAAARGIGRAIAVELAARGAAVAVNYRNSKEHARSLAEQIRELGVDCMLVPGDVANEEDARHVVQTVLDAWKRLDILVNNAGITRDKSLRKRDDDEWADVININLSGTYYCTSAALPAMMEQQFGRIINISSYADRAHNLGQGKYPANPGGIMAFTKSLALEMARYNITANAIAPGFTSTEMLDRIPPTILEHLRVRIPLQRFARPDEVAKAAAFLAADADYITGQQLNVNGGLYV
jgi:acetoacetyl-CoA reductase